LNDAAVSVEDLRVVRGGNEVLHDLSLDVAFGSVTGLLGLSGCGKTTLMRAIVGVQIVASGGVRVLGLPAGTPELRRRVGYVTQAPSVYGDLSIEENLRYFAAIVDAPGERVARTMDTVGLGGRDRQHAVGSGARAVRQRVRADGVPCGAVHAPR
jgi:ABC-type multidrug transport system ATPase subunit